MRDGRRMEIPDKFTVSSSTVTYKAGSDIQVTIQLNTVDVAATERANGEAAGSFLRRASAPQPVANNVSQGRRTAAGQLRMRISKNTGARASRVRRLTNWSARSWACLRARNGGAEAAAIQDRTLEQVRNMREQQEMEEAAYWRGRAESMRGRMASQAEMDLWRGSPVAGSIVYPMVVSSRPKVSVLDIGDRRFRRFGRFRVSDPFSGFLSTPITPFPRFPSSFRRPIFVAPRGRVNRVHRTAEAVAGDKRAKR